MEPIDEQQQEEITALRSIFGADFADTPAPKAWKVTIEFLEIGALSYLVLNYIVGCSATT